MSLTVYSFDINIALDDDFINSTQEPEYIAWQIGRAENLELGLWLIKSVVETPTDLTTLLPVGYTSFELLDDVGKYGFKRSMLPNLSIDDLQALFITEVAAFTAAITP